jgi:hypothetical protein
MHQGYDEEVLKLFNRWQTILVKFIAENLAVEEWFLCQPSYHTSYKSLLARQML